MTPLVYILVCLATYRVTTDLAWEDGPFEAFTRLRSLAAARFGQGHWIAEGIACPICGSFWAAPVLLLLWPYAPWLVTWLAVAGAVALLVRLK